MNLVWSLIVLFTTYGSNSGVSITALPNTYATEQACQAAGTKAVKDIESFTTTVRFSCSNSGAKP